MDAMNKQDLIEELEMDVEVAIQRYKKACGSSQEVIAWFVDYLEQMIKAQPQQVRDKIRYVVHQRICGMN